MTSQYLIIGGTVGICLSLAVLTAGFIWRARTPTNVLTINQFDWMNSHVPDWRERLQRGESVTINVPPDHSPVVGR